MCVCVQGSLKDRCDTRWTPEEDPQQHSGHETADEPNATCAGVRQEKKGAGLNPELTNESAETPGSLTNQKKIARGAS